MKSRQMQCKTILKKILSSNCLWNISGKEVCCIFSHQIFFMRRIEFLQSTAAIAGASLLPNITLAKNSKPGKIRFAYLTDIHVKPDLIVETGMAKAFNHVQSLKSKANFIVNGGDSIMDSLEADKQKTRCTQILFH